MEKEIVSQVQEAQRVPYRISPRRNTPRHILIKLTKTKHKEIKSSKGEATSNIQGKPHMFNSWSFSKNASGKKGMAVYIKVLKGKNLQPRLPRKDLIQNWWRNQKLSVQFSSVTQSCPTLCDPMNRSTPGLPVHHQLPEFTQTQVHWVGDATQPSHPRSSPSPPALNLFQDQGLFQWFGSSHQVVKVLELQLQHQSFQWTPRTYLF